jgi:enoyl-CoA hydratase/carnithine racemase
MGKLFIGAVSGAAAGAGANLALSCDFVICAENAKFIQAFAGIARVPDTGGSFLLCRSIGAQRALELCITGRPLSAEEAMKLGLVYKIVPADQSMTARGNWQKFAAPAVCSLGEHQ